MLKLSLWWRRIGRHDCEQQRAMKLMDVEKGVVIWLGG